MLWQPISRFALAFALVLGLSVPARAQVTLTNQQVANQAFGTTLTTPTLTVNAGDLIVVTIRERDANIPATVSCATSGALTLAAELASGSGGYAGVYYFRNASGTDETCTVTYGANRVYTISASAWGGAATSGTPDHTSTGTNASGTTHTCGSGVTTTESGLIIASHAWSASPSTVTPATNFTAMTAGSDRQYPSYWITSGGQTTAVSTTTTNSVVSTCAMATFAQVGGAASAPRMTLLGVGQ